MTTLNKTIKDTKNQRHRQVIAQKSQRRSKKIRLLDHFSWKVGLVAVCAVFLLSVGLTYIFKPYTFRRAYRAIEKVFCKNPSTSDVVLPSNEIVGIDVSYYQEDIDWKNVSFLLHPITNTLTKDVTANKRKVDFVIAKATEGITIKDPKYARNRKGAKEQGILFGAYHFFSVRTDAKEQALHFIKEAKLQKGDLVPVLDVEYQGQLSSSELRKRVLVWLKTVTEHYGKRPIIYTYARFHDEIFDTEEFAGYNFWMAHYGVDKPEHDCRFWQFTEEGVVGGIKGYVDIDVFFGDTLEIQDLLLK